QMSRLLAAENVSRTAEFQVESCDAKTGPKVGKFADRTQPAAGDGCEFEFAGNEQICIRAAVRTAYAAAKLIKLRQAVIIRSVDDDRVRTRNVDAVLDDRCRYQNVEFMIDEIEHYLPKFLLVHLAVTDSDTRVRHDLLQMCGDRLDRFDAVVNEKHLAVAAQFEFDGGTNDVLAELNDLSVDRQTVARRCFDDGKVTHSQQRHIQRSRYGRRRKRQYIDLFLQLFEFFFVSDAEPLLFVNYNKAEFGQFYVGRKNAVRADQNIDPALFRIGRHGFLLLWRTEPRRQFDLNRK